MAEADSASPLPAAFSSALPQIVRLHAPCPCSHAGRVYMQKNNILQDLDGAFMSRPCAGHEKGFANWVDYLQHARPLKDPAHQCIRQYIQEQQISGPSRGSRAPTAPQETEKDGRRRRRSIGSRGTATAPLQNEPEEKTDRRLVPREKQGVGNLKRELTVLERITSVPVIVEVSGLKLKQTHKARLTQAITDVLPEASKYITGLYPRMNRQGDFLGSVAIEFEKKEEGRLLGYLTTLSFQSAYLDPEDRDAIAAYPELAKKLRGRSRITS